MRPQFYTAQPQPTAEEVFDVAAPVMGMDGTVPLHNMPEGKAVYLYNIYPAEYGCRTREGHRTWAQNLSGGVGPTRSIIPFVGDLEDLSLARLFTATAAGIYNVTVQGADNPTAVVTFPSSAGEAGFCEWTHFTDPNGLQTILVADGENGLYEYNPTGSVWTKLTTEITFPDSTTPGDIVFITSHKDRIWLIAKDSADAYYLPIGAKYGAATKFQFGSKMRHGGILVGLWDWSVDGGEGVDDYLLGLSKGGDLIVYRGSDPAQSSEWDMVGRWFIGPPPKGRRVAVPVGGDTLLLSEFGLTSVAGLMQGVDPTRVERNVTGKITRLVREEIKDKKRSDYWQTVILPEEGLCVINSPRDPDERYIQFVLNLNRVSEDTGGGWGIWRDLPTTCFDTFEGKVYFGTEDGRVQQMDGSLDNVAIDGTGGTPVSFSMLTGFSHFRAPAIHKQVQWIRPQFISTNVVEAACRAVYDYDLQELANLPGLAPAPSPFDWDVGNWDAALWSGISSDYVISGGFNHGREVAISIQGEASSRLTLVSIEGTWTRWAFL